MNIITILKRSSQQNIGDRYTRTFVSKVLDLSTMCTPGKHVKLLKTFYTEAGEMPVANNS